MAKFLVVYHSPVNPVVDGPPEGMDMDAEMKAWMDWGARVGDKLSDFGAPLAGGVHIAADGSTAPSTLEVSGYSMMEAENMDAVLALTKDHPHLKSFPGSAIEVHELQADPGM